MPDDRPRYDEDTYVIKTASGNEVKVVLKSKDGGVRRISVSKGNDKDEFVSRTALETLLQDQKNQSAIIERQGALVVAHRQELDAANYRITELTKNLEDCHADQKTLQRRISEYQARQPDADPTQNTVEVSADSDLSAREKQVATLETLLLQKREDIQTQLKEHYFSVEKECNARKKDADARIMDADKIITAANARQQKSEGILAEAKKALESTNGYMRMLSKVTEMITQYVRDDIEYCTNFIQEVKERYNATSASIILGILYTSKLKQKPESCDMHSGVTHDIITRLRAKTYEAKSETLVGIDDSLKGYYVEPMRIEDLKIAHFCLTGIPTENGMIPEDVLKSITGIAGYLTKRICSNYFLLQMTEVEEHVKYQRNLLEQQIAALKT
jgi:hypothetical protein